MGKQKSADDSAMEETIADDCAIAEDESKKAIPGPTTEREEYEALCQLVNPIAQPLANRKLAKKLYKLVKKSAKEKGSMRHGLADVMKALRKGEKGIVILAGLNDHSLA
jgi:H/ACA ribonucleoprotein complex subunit 2